MLRPFWLPPSALSADEDEVAAEELDDDEEGEEDEGEESEMLK